MTKRGIKRSLLSMRYSSSINGTSTRCSEGHLFRVRFFLCPTLMSCSSLHLSHFNTVLKVHYLYSVIFYKFFYFFFSWLKNTILHGKDKTWYKAKNSNITAQYRYSLITKLYLYVQEIVLALISLANHNLHRQSSKPIKLRT